MSTIRYGLEVGTRNLNLSTNEISRAYALLISNIWEGQKYGFEYEFFKRNVSQLDSAALLGERNTHQDTEWSEIITSDNADSKNYIMNNHYIADNRDDDSIIITNTPLMESDYIHIDLAKQIVGDNKDKLIRVVNDYKLFDNQLHIGHIDDNMIEMIDNTENVCEKLDIIIKMAETRQDHLAKQYNHMKQYTNNTERSGITITQSTARRLTSDYAWINHIMIQSKSSDYKQSVNMDRMVFMKTYGSSSWINHDYIVSGNGLGHSWLDHSYIYGDNKQTSGHLDYNKVLSDARNPRDIFRFSLINFTKEVSKIIYKNKFTNYGSRYEKNFRFNKSILYERTQMREMLTMRSKTFYRHGKPDTFINHTYMPFDRVGKTGKIVIPLKSFERWYKQCSIIRKQYRYSRVNKLIDIRENMLYSTRYNVPTEILNPKIFYTSGVTPLRVGDLPTSIIMEKVLRNAFLDKTMVLATQPEKISVVKLFHTFDARVVNKVIFSDKARKGSAKFAPSIKAVRDRHEIVVFIDFSKGVISETIAEIKTMMNEAIIKGCDSIVLVGLNSADNHQTESEMLISKVTADSKEYMDVVINLMALGWNKAAHDTNIDIELIDVDNPRIRESLANEVLELATGMNKDRLANVIKMQEFAERNKDKLQAIEHGFLIRMHRIPEQKPIDISKLQLAEWDTEWAKLCNIAIESKDKYDKIKVPNDDYDYSKLIKQVYDTTTGVPFKPKSPINVPEVEVNLPIEHYSARYSNLVREEIPVDLYIYKDTMLLIWIFWCRNRSLSENILGTLKEFYETQNLEMTMFQEFAKITQMDASQAINYVLDKVHNWIQNTISYYDPDRMNQYERVMKQVRWFGEKVANELSKYILVREYIDDVINVANILTIPNIFTDDITINSSGRPISTNPTVGRIYTTSHVQPVDGELVVEATIRDVGRLKILIDDQEKISVISPGIYLENNPSNSTFINPAIRIELPAGSYNVKILLENGVGNVEIISIKSTNKIFSTASMKFESKPGTGTQAIDKILSMMYDYYEIHHKDKAKGERNLWLSE